MNPVRTSGEGLPDKGVECPSRTVLTLLGEEAPISRIEELVRTAEQNEVPADELTDIRRAVTLGMSVRALADQRRRRAANLTALVETAREITMHSDLGTVLDITISHARRLLDLDMAYVSLRGPTGDSHVHSSAGGTTAQGIGLEIGVEDGGLGALSPHRHAPFWTPDYVADNSFPHSPAIDHAVRSEGLHAVVAVPMSLGDEPIGTLYGADREIRHFTPEDIMLLRSLAALSASAVGGARRADRHRAEIDGVRAELATLRTSAALRESAERFRAELTDIVMTGGDLHQIVAAAQEGLGGPVEIRDAAGVPLVTAGELPAVEVDEVVRTLAAAQRAGRPLPVTGTVWIASVVGGGDGSGAVLATAPAHPDDGWQRLVRHVADATALALLLLRAGEVTGPRRDECLDDLLDGTHSSPRRLAERMRRLGIDHEGAHVVVVLRPEAGRPGEDAIWASNYAHQHRGLKTMRDESIVLLLPGADADEAAHSAAHALSAQLGHPVSAGGAGPVRSLQSLGPCFREAMRCLDTLIALGGPGGSATAHSLGFLGLLLSDGRDADSFVTSSLGPVLEHDAERATDLQRTLDAYFASGGSPTRAAQHLNVHVNTVSRRLERISELLGPDWQQPDNALEIQLALRLQRTREAVYGDATPSRLMPSTAQHGSAADRPR